MKGWAYGHLLTPADTQALRDSSLGSRMGTCPRRAAISSSLPMKGDQITLTLR